LTTTAEPRTAMRATPASTLVRLRQLLPKGVPLTDQAWQRRHRFIQLVLWLQVPMLLAVGLARGFTPLHTVSEVLPIASLALLGYHAQGRGMKAILISTGLLTTEAVLVHFTGGLIESHFAFFVMLPLIALYQDLRAFFIALGFVVVHHSVMTILVPRSVFNHPAAQAKPILWAGIHAGFVLALVAVMMAFWRFAEQAQVELARAAEGVARSAADVERVGSELARSADTQSLTIEMINQSLGDVQDRVERSQLTQADPELAASLSQIVEAVRLIGGLTEQHARNSDLAAQATTDLTAQATHLGSLVSPVGAR
jgi:methyl-accepting chemotaxis protein